MTQNKIIFLGESRQGHHFSATPLHLFSTDANETNIQPQCVTVLLHSRSSISLHFYGRKVKTNFARILPKKPIRRLISRKIYFHLIKAVGCSTNPDASPNDKKVIRNYPSKILFSAKFKVQIFVSSILLGYSSRFC